MKRSSANKTILILFGIIIVPIAFYTWYQVGSLNQNEKMLAQIYKNQLESILFSVNQYSDDLIKSLEFKLQNSLSSQQKVSPELLASYPGIREIGLYSLDEDQFQFISGDSAGFLAVSEIVISRNKQLIEKLVEYKDLGFTKLEPLEPVSYNGSKHNVLVMLIGDEKKTLCFLFIDPLDFVEEFLAPKMQAISAEQFVITAREAENDLLIFSTDSIDDVEDLDKPLWLLPNYKIGIIQKGDSLEKISAERHKLNLIWIALLSVILLLGFIVIARNIRKEIQFAQMKSDFVSNVSHEIRTPLTLINMFAETLMLDRVPSEEKKKEYYEIISKETSRLKNIVNKILNFSKIQTNRRTYQLLSESLNDITKETIHTYSFHLNNQGFSYDIAYEDSIPAVTADREAIMESIINLIDNAMKYSGDSKKVKLWTGISNHMVYVAIKDYGIGIDPKKQNLIFDKFFRVTHGDIYQVQGAGLGLSIVKNIMDAHDGRIELESTPGKGSTFKLLFPIKNT